jgi:hypothetical protein
MKTRTLIFAVVTTALATGCGPGDSSALDPGAAAEVQGAVRLLADSIAHDVTHDGPNAWLRYFEPAPGFFMASAGSIAFPNFDSAAAFVPRFAAGIRAIELSWSGVRVDPLTTRLAVMGASFTEVITDTAGGQLHIGGYFTAIARQTPSGWRLRDANWSMGDQSK